MRTDRIRRHLRSRLPAVLITVAGGLAGPTATVAQSVIELPAADRPISADFDEVFRIGSFDGEVWETFGEIAGVSFDAAGNLYILDRQANQITVVDSEGTFVRTIGQAGEGPGEFRMAMGFTTMPDGRVVVADIGHPSFQIFDETGAFERMVAMSMDGGSLRLGPIQPHPEELAVISGGGGGAVVSMRQGPGGGSASEPVGRPVELLSLVGESVEATTLLTAWAPPPGEPETMEGGGMQIRMGAVPRTFEPDLFVGVLPDGGIAYSDSSTWEIEVLGRDGRAQRTLRRPFEPVPLTERMENAERERRLAELEEGEGPQMRMMVAGPGGGGAQPVNQDAIRDMMRGRIEQMQFYHELPVLMGVETSWGGKIWAQRRGDAPTEPGPVDVLTPTGQYIGTYAAGSTAMPSAFGPDGLAAFIEADDFEVPVVVVRRLPGAVR